MVDLYVAPGSARARSNVHDFDSGSFVDLDALCGLIAGGAGP